MVSEVSYRQLLWQAWNAYLKRAAAYQSALLLNVIYFLVLGPSVVIARLAGTQLLDLGYRNRSTYWIARRRDEVTLEALRRQF